MRRSFLIITLAISFLQAGPIQAGQELDIGVYEKELSSQVKGLPPERRFYLYLLAGRELLDWKAYVWARKYFQLAVDQDTQDDKSEAYVKLVHLAYLDQDKALTKKMLGRLDDYWKEREARGHKAHKAQGLEVHYRAWADPENKSAYEAAVKAGSGPALAMDSALHYQLMRSGQYKEALAGLHPGKVIASQSVDLQAEFDLLNILVNKDSRHTLTCEQLWEKFKNSYSYGILICGILKDFQANGKVTPAKLKELDDYFDVFDEDMHFLAEAVKKLSS